MSKMHRYPTLFVGLAILLMVLAGCSSGEDVDSPSLSALTIPSTPAPGPGPSPTAVAVSPSVTPAPSGFVPGDALPTTAPAPTAPAATPTQTVTTFVNGRQYRELTWEELVPLGYRPEDIIAKYQDELNAFEDGDPAAMDLYQQMQEEFNNAPINSALDQSDVRIPGFIAPLEYENDLITEFLLVPYFGACIHVPPPPVNQTVYVSLADGEGITPEESYYPVWVHGFMTTAEMNTDIGNAGYRIEEAVIKPYDYAS